MQQKSERRSNADRTETTRRALIEAARQLFIERSYGETGTPDIVAAAGVTRGALYHHFPDKQTLFAAVVEREAAEVAAEIEHATADDPDPLQALQRGGEAYIRAMAQPGRARLLLLDGPAVLGRGAMDAIDLRHGARTLREGLEAAVQAGAIVEAPVRPLCALLSASFDRAVLGIAGGDDTASWKQALAVLIAGLATRG